VWVGLMQVWCMLHTICGVRKVARRAFLRLNPPFKFLWFLMCPQALINKPSTQYRLRYVWPE
jgi:hypothetical protein